MTDASPAATFQAAVAHHRAGQFDEAAALYAQVIAAMPEHSDAWQLSGAVCMQQKKYTEAVERMERAVSLGAAHPVVLSNLGAAYRAIDRNEEAIRCLTQAVERDPTLADAWNNLGNAYKGVERFDEAFDAYTRALNLRPEHTDAHDNLARLHQTRGETQQAMHHYQKTLQLKPLNPRSWNNYGTLLLDQGATPEALKAFDTAISQRADYSRAWNNRGTALRALGKPTEAEAAFRRAVEIEPGLTQALNNLGEAIGVQGRSDEAMTILREVIAQAPKEAAIHSNYLMQLLYHPGTTMSELAAAHREWNARHAAPLRPTHVTWPQTRDPARRIRIGFVSADFNRHPVGCIMLPMVAHLDRGAFEVCGYATKPAFDPVQQQLRQSSDQWHEVSRLLDDALCQKIRADQIDVLVDLSGHTAHHRLSVFARRAAPVQVSWAGYQATTGLDEMDYLVTDQHMSPAGDDQHYNEKVVRLAEAAWCCHIDNPPQEIGQPPARTRGAVTFASFNNPSKLSPDVIYTWAAVLRATPGSRLILKYRGLNDPGVVERFRQRFQAAGISADRVDFRGQTPFQQMLAEYGEADIALDPFPFNGGMTSLIALRMGLPVVTLPGVTIASRQTISMLNNVGVVDTIARDRDDYVAIAARLAGDLDLLSGLRAKLSQQITQTAFLDPKKFVPAWSAAIRTMWTAWCNN